VEIRIGRDEPVRQTESRKELQPEKKKQIGQQYAKIPTVEDVIKN